jgi:hypothetical protein
MLLARGILRKPGESVVRVNADAADWPKLRTKGNGPSGSDCSAACW